MINICVDDWCDNCPEFEPEKSVLYEADAFNHSVKCHTTVYCESREDVAQ